MDKIRKPSYNNSNPVKIHRETIIYFGHSPKAENVYSILRFGMNGFTIAIYQFYRTTCSSLCLKLQVRSNGLYKDYEFAIVIIFLSEIF